MRSHAHQTGEAAGPEAELGLIMGVDQPQAAVDLLQAGAAQQTLEEFYRSSRPLDFQELGNSRGTLPAPLQNPAVQPGRQQVKIRKAGQPAVGTHLLVAAERHLPGREGDECKAGTGFKIRSHAAHELILVPDMLDDVVAENQVKLPL